MTNGTWTVAGRRATRFWGLAAGGLLVMILGLGLVLNGNRLSAGLDILPDTAPIYANDANDDDLITSDVYDSREARVDRRTSSPNAQQFDIPIVVSPYDAIITSPEADWIIYARPAAFGSFNFGHQGGDSDKKGGRGNGGKDETDNDDNNGDDNNDDNNDNDDNDDNNDKDGNDDKDDGVEYPDGLTGKLVLVETSGCFEDNQAGNQVDLSDSIALVLRGNCGFYEKVLNLQSWGAIAVIVGDNIYGRGLVTMYKSDDSHDIKIPSVFVTRSSYEDLRLVKIIHISLENNIPSFFDTLLFGFISPLFSITIIYLLFMFNRYYKGTLERAPVSYVNKLPTRLWMGVAECTSGGSSTASIPNLTHESSSGARNNETTALLPSKNNLFETIDENGHSNNAGNNSSLLKSYNSLDHFPPPSANLSSGLLQPKRVHHHEKVWVSSAECIICLEEYEIGQSMVMRLPCGHDFHVDCIKQWLINEKRTCPICKQDIMTKDWKNTIEADNPDSEVSSISNDFMPLLERIRYGWRSLIGERENGTEQMSNNVISTNDSSNGNSSDDSSTNDPFLV